MSPREKAKEIIDGAIKEGRKYLMEYESKMVCQAYGLPVARSVIARTAEEAVKLSREIGYPVVLKIASPDVIHKTDVGGVIVGVKNDEEVVKAYEKIMENVKKHKPDARIIGVLVQEMAPQSTEVIVGMVRDSQFGPAIMFGLGGIFVEILKDVSFRIAPLTPGDAREMIQEIKAYPVLKGYRNLPPADIDALVDVILKTSQLSLENPEVSQLDLNPIFVYEKGAKIVDARIILG